MNDVDLARSIEVTFEGPDIGPGWVPVPSLVAVLDGLQHAVVAVVEDLWGRRRRRGPVPAEIQRQATFRLGAVRAGSFGATLTLQEPDQPGLFDVQAEAVSRLLEGIDEHLVGRVSELPDAALRHIQAVAERVRRTGHRVVLEGGQARKRVVVSGETPARPDARPPKPEVSKVRVSGRLLEIDYRDGSAEIWDALGKMTRIRFAESQRAMVDAARLQLVTVTGLLDTASTSKVGAITLESIEPIRADERFWRTPSLADLAAEQGVRPIEDPSDLVADFWEEDDEEEFLAALRRWRRES